MYSTDDVTSKELQAYYKARMALEAKRAVIINCEAKSLR